MTQKNKGTPPIRPQPGIMEIALYQGGKSHVEGAAQVVKLSSNENPLGSSDKAKEAFLRAAHTLHRYPGTDHLELRAAIGECHGLDPGRIICGVGSDEIIALLCQAYAGPGDEVVHTQHGFLMYRISALAAGAQPICAPETNRKVDVEALLRALSPRTRLVFIANPGNPTGTMLSPSELEALADALPAGVLLVLDGAYAEYVEGYDGGAHLAGTRENVFMTRTFSKIYGLGGLRVGWGYGPAPIIEVLNRIRGPFNLSNVQLEVARAAVLDQDWPLRCRTENARMRAWLANALHELGVPSDPSEANFILARFASVEEAAACNAFLLEQGLIVRGVESYGLPDCLRITVGDEASCRRLAHAVAHFKAGTRPDAKAAS